MYHDKGFVSVYDKFSAYLISSPDLVLAVRGQKKGWGEGGREGKGEEETFPPLPSPPPPPFLCPRTAKTRYGDEITAYLALYSHRKLCFQGSLAESHLFWVLLVYFILNKTLVGKPFLLLQDCLYIKKRICIGNTTYVFE